MIYEPKPSSQLQRTIEKVVERMRFLLSAHRKNRKQSPHACYDACRAYSKVLKAKKSLESAWYENTRE